MPSSRYVSQLLTVAAIAALGARADTVTVQANDTSIQYSSNVQWSGSQACGGTVYSFGLWQSFIFHFTGTSISLIGTQDAYGGTVDVELDGKTTPYNRYSSVSGYDPQCNQVIFQQSGLDNVDHTLVVTHSGADSSYTYDQFFEWQYLTYTTEAKKSSVAPIVGGVVGGIAAVVGAILVWWFGFRRGKARHEQVDLNGAGPPEMQQATPYPVPAPPPRVGPTTDRQAAVSSISYTNSDGTQPNNRQPWAPAPVLRRGSISKGGESFAAQDDFNPYALAAMPAAATAVPAPGSVEGSSSAAGSSSKASKALPSVPTSNTEKAATTSSSSSPQPRPAALSPQVQGALPPMSETDLERLAARVASMMATSGGSTNGQQPAAAPAPTPAATTHPEAARSTEGDPDDAPPEYTRM